MMGQPLDFPINVRLAPDEILTPGCLSAEVTLGERRLAAAAVSTVLEMTGTQSARIRVRTSLSVDEPVVGVLLTANCGTVRMSRRFVVLADPPLQVAAPQPVAAFVPAFAAAPIDVPPAAEAVPVSRADMAAASSDAAARAGTSTAVADARAAAEPVATRSAGAGPRATAAKAPTPRAARLVERRKAAPPADRPRPALHKAAAVALAAPAPAARLRLDAAEPLPEAQVTVEEALMAVAQAASAARAAASAAAVSAARIAALERDLGELRKETASSRESTALLRERLIGAERAGRWTWPLLALVLLMISLLAWLGWRLNGAERKRQRGWQAPGPASGLTPSKLPTAPIPFVTSELMLPANVPPARPRHAWPAPAPADTRPPPPDDVRTTEVSKAAPPSTRPEYEAAMQRTEPLPPQGAIDLAAARDVSIEELIDLEQQAEFFVVLGQDDAAIDLLVEHLRNTGGGSPLPYLKLLEIYHRRGEREHYERTRTRFNHRFNAYAPEWGIDLQAGRSLESYPGVVPRLQQVWPRPLDAMAELEALLFRKSRGEFFDLPAYREVLFLYSLARDLMDREEVATGSVDLLLPLGDGSAFCGTSPVLPTTPATAAPPSAASPDATVLDFDLTADTGPETSLFGTLEDTPDRKSRR